MELNDVIVNQPVVIDNVNAAEPVIFTKSTLTHLIVIYSKIIQYIHNAQSSNITTFCNTIPSLLSSYCFI